MNNLSFPVQSKTCDKEGETHGTDAKADKHLRASETRASEATSAESQISLSHEVRHRFLPDFYRESVDFSRDRLLDLGLLFFD